MAETPSTGAGPRVLVLDDEALLAFEIEIILSRAGYRVLGPVYSIPEAELLLSRKRPDGAVLDLGIGAHSSDIIADLLADRGVPFLFLSGYTRANMPARHATRPLLTKPVREADLLATVGAMLD